MGNLVLRLTSDLCDPNCSRADLIVFTQLRFDKGKATIEIGFSGAGTKVNLVFTRPISISTNPAYTSENTCVINTNITIRRTNTFVVPMLVLMSQFSLMRKGATLAQAQAKGSQPYRPPSCLTSREAGMENSVKKWSSARVSVNWS